MDPRLAELLYLAPIESPGRVMVFGPVENELIGAIKSKFQNVLVNLNEERENENPLADLVLCVTTKLSNEMNFISRLIAPGGVFCSIEELRKNSNPKKKKQRGFLLTTELRKAGFENVSYYGLTPSVDEFRLAVPLINRRLTSTSLALYQPSLRKAKLRKLMAHFLGYCGLAKIWTPYIFTVAKKTGGEKDKGLKQLLSIIHGTEIEISLFSGTPGYRRKPTVQVMDFMGNILSYGKIAHNPVTLNMLENEAKALSLLKNIDLGRALVPAALFFGHIGEKSKILLQSTCKRGLSSSHMSPKKSHHDFLVRLFMQTRVKTDFRASACLNGLQKRVNKLSRKYSDEWPFLLKRSIDMATKNMVENRVFLGFAHRDFTPWNTFTSKGRLFVFDWEFAKEEWPPLADAFHFIIQKAILVDKALPEKIFEKVSNENFIEGSFLNRLCANIEVKNSSILTLMTLYLLDIATVYLDNFSSQGEEIDSNGQMLLNGWKALLKIIMSKN